MPLINNDATGEEYRSVLCHEALGHGLAKLVDEYAYEANNTSLPTSDVQSMATYRVLMAGVQMCLSLLQKRHGAVS